MQKSMSRQELELELAKARKLAAAGKSQEALMAALNLLQHSLGQLRQGLLALHGNLARLKTDLAEASNLQNETSGNSGLSPTGRRIYH
ncbi:MAG: hypothetical protein QME75_04290 [Deltaproteobacteria bacterium]|nr:hypothetical protein [Deltaproteobacteria bacterium]